MVEISSSMLRATYGSLERLIDRFQPDLVHFCDNPGPIAGLLKRRHPRLPFVMVKPTVAIYEGASAHAYRLFLTSSLAPADLIITYTHAAREALVANGIDRTRIQVLPWGVPPPAPCHETTRERIRSRYHVAGEELLVVVAPRGTLEDTGALIGDAIEAARILPLQFVIAVRPSLYAGVRAVLDQQEKLKTARGKVRLENGPTDFFELLWAADALFSNEGSRPATSLLPLTWLEAMARGTPVLTSSRPGVTDAILPGQTGLLFEPGTRPFSAFRQIIEPGVLETLSRGALEQVSQRFMIGPIATQYRQLWEQVRTQGTPPHPSRSDRSWQGAR